jgi:hypothetical protein
MKKIRPHVFKDQRGFTLVFLGLSIIVLLGFAALAVDIGYLYAARNELQNAADAAALAGARELGKIYLDKGAYTKNTTLGGDTYRIFLAAKEVAGKNAAAGESVSLTVFALKDENGKKVPDENNVSPVGADVVLGEWQPSALPGVDKLKTSGVTQPDAVRVYAKRQKNVNPVTLFFANVLGIADAGVSAVATAALSGPPAVPTSDLPIPFAMGTGWPTRNGSSSWCAGNIITYPTNECVGWHTYMTVPTGKKIIDGILDKLLALQYPIPLNEVPTGTVFEGFGGNWDINTCNKLRDLFNMMKIKNDDKWDLDTDPATWTTMVVIYKDDDCGWNPNKPFNIVGFTTITISDIVCPGPKLIAKAVCDVEPFRGGGSTFGVKGSIPGLVQ